MQRHQIENCDTLFNTIAQKAGGINDNPEPEQASLVSYSAEKVDNLVNKFHTRLIVTIPASGWSGSYPYTNVVQIPGVTKNMNFQVIGLQHQNNPSYSQVKLDKKNMGMLMGNKAGVGDGSITFHAYKKPTADFTIVVEGGLSKWGELFINVSGGGGISDDITARQNDVLKGKTAITSDSDDEIVEGTLELPERRCWAC